MHRPGADSKGSLTAWPAEDLGRRAGVDHLDPYRRDPDCAQWPPWQELGLVAWEEATVDRVEAGTLLCIEAWRGRT